MQLYAWIPALMVTLWMLLEYSRLPSGCAMCGGRHEHKPDCPNGRN
jgi:hypothetical protein